MTPFSRALRAIIPALRAVVVVLPLVLSEAGAADAGRPFPDARALGIEGAWPATKGKVVLVDFWASWCGPCKKSFPALEALHRRYQSRGLVVIGVSVDEDAAAMKGFLKNHPVTFPIVRDAKHRLVESVNAKAMPTSLLVDRAGTIRFVNAGFKGAETEAEMTRQIEQLLKGSK